MSAHQTSPPRFLVFEYMTQPSLLFLKIQVAVNFFQLSGELKLLTDVSSFTSLGIWNVSEGWLCLPLLYQQILRHPAVLQMSPLIETKDISIKISVFLIFPRILIVSQYTRWDFSPFIVLASLSPSHDQPLFSWLALVKDPFRHQSLIANLISLVRQRFSKKSLSWFCRLRTQIGLRLVALHNCMDLLIDLSRYVCRRQCKLKELMWSEFEIASSISSRRVLEGVESSQTDMHTRLVWYFLLSRKTQSRAYTMLWSIQVYLILILSAATLLVLVFSIHFVELRGSLDIDLTIRRSPTFMCSQQHQTTLSILGRLCLLTSRRRQCRKQVNGSSWIFEQQILKFKT